MNLLKEHIRAKMEYEICMTRTIMAKKRMVKTWTKLSERYLQNCFDVPQNHDSEFENDDIRINGVII